MSDGGNGGGLFDLEAGMELVERAARRAILDLVVASHAQETEAATFAATRLRWSVIVAEQIAERHVSERRPQFDARLATLRAQALRWLPPEPIGVTVEAVQRFLSRCRVTHDGVQPWLDASGASIDGLDLDRLDLPKLLLRGAKVSEMRARNAILELIDASGAHVAASWFHASSMTYGVFDDGIVTESDFSRADLRRSSWRRARVVGCTAIGANLRDARFDAAYFGDCDFRGARFGSANVTHGRAPRGARFERCDLRETEWNERDLAGFVFVDCRMHGVHGAPVLGDVVIERPDLSPEGNGSQRGGAGDVIRRWDAYAVAGRRRSRS